MAEAGWYNGYSPKERAANFKELKRRVDSGELLAAAGPCLLCHDPDVQVEYHNEDYGEPFLSVPPALLPLCRHCHRDKLHKRFWRHSAWQAYVAHIRRGGHASDLKNSAIKRELAEYRTAIEAGKPFVLQALRPYLGVAGQEWFANLRMDPESLTDPKARPRP